MVIKRPLNRPFPLPAHRIFTDFCSRFVKGISGAPRGGIMSLEGVKFSKRFKLPTDLFHHTHEVWGPCSYKNTPLRRHGPRVLASYCGLPLFRPHFSTLGHFHTTILVTTYFGVKIRCAAASGRGAYSTACIKHNLLYISKNTIETHFNMETCTITLKYTTVVYSILDSTVN